MTAKSPEEQESENRERNELQERIADWLDVPLTVLAFVMLALLIMELMLDLSPAVAQRVAQIQMGIWAMFVAAFLFEFFVAPSKLQYLRKNWITAISALLPAFRAIRILRVARALRGLNLVRILTTLNRGARALGDIATRGQFGYVILLTVIIVLTAASGVFFFERGQPGALIASPGEALWWALTVVTTINAGLEPVTIEGRVIGVLLRVFALGVSGYLTAMFAVYLLGWETSQSSTSSTETELHELRIEMRQLRQLVERQSGGEPERTINHD